ncbi:MAG: PIN domain-containing protein [Chthoniobacterales bacterium]
MRFLVDADVLSEATKPVPDPRALDWLKTHERTLVVTPIILGELEFGILLLPAGRKRKDLESWFARGRSRLRVLDFDAACGAAWARLLARLRKSGQSMPVKDSLIAASALAHRLPVATRNIRDFRPAGVPLVNPFDEP